MLPYSLVLPGYSCLVILNLVFTFTILLHFATFLSFVTYLLTGGTVFAIPYYMTRREFPDLDPRDQILFNTKELTEKLRIDKRKLYRIRKEAGIEPLRKTHDNARYYTYEQAQELIRLIYTPESIWKIIRENRRKSKEAEEQEL